MRTKTISIYTIDELSPKARERALEKTRESWDFAWSYEWRDTLDAFCKVFPIKSTRWEVGAFCPSYCKGAFTGDFNPSGVRLFKYLQNSFANVFDHDFDLTGFCGDESIMAPIRKFMKRPDNRDFEELLQDCLDEWARDFQADMESQLEDEYLLEHARINQYEFLEDGSFA